MEGVPPVTPDGALRMVCLGTRTGSRYDTEETRRYSASRSMPGADLAQYVEFWKAWWSGVKQDFPNRSLTH